MSFVHIIESFETVAICVFNLTEAMSLSIFPLTNIAFAIAQDPAAATILFSCCEVALIYGAIVEKFDSSTIRYALLIDFAFVPLHKAFIIIKSFDFIALTRLKLA